MALAGPTSVEVGRSPSSSSASSIPVAEDKLRLVSFIGGETITFDWKPDEPQRNTELVSILFEVIGLCIKRLPCALPSVLHHLDNGSATFNNVDKTNLEEVRAVIEDFNKVAAPYAKLWKGQTNPAFESWSQDRADVDLLTIICTLSFSRAVSNPQLLNNHYAPFSSGVYGETSYEQMQMIIDQTVFRDSDVFLDLGCGVGQLVMYVAGGTKVKKSVGIEINDLPAKYGAAMSEDFSKWMKWWKKKCRPFQLIHGDMLDEQYRNLITQEATIIFINNYAFEPSLDLHIKNMLADCHVGTRIISTKAYATGTKRVNMRNLGDVESIMEVTQLKTVKQPTSWTPNNVPYYLHTVTHNKMMNFFTQRKNGGELSRSVSSSSKSGSRSPDSVERNRPPRNDSAKVEEGEDAQGDNDSKAHGPTTRNRWKVYVNQCEEKKKRGSPMPGSPRWNEADTDYVPPGLKKQRKAHHGGSASHHKGESSKKQAVRFRPTVRVSDDAREGIEKMHALISTPRPVDTNVGEGLVRVDLPHNTQSSEKLYSEGEELNDGRSVVRIIDKETEDVLSAKVPIDALCLSYRNHVLAFLEYMKTPSFRLDIERDIANERARNAELLEKVRQASAAVAAQRSQGVCALYERLNDLGMSDVETPTELLQGSKQIVAHHKDLNQRVSCFETEVAMLEGRVRAVRPYGDKLVEALHSIGDNPLNVEDLLQTVLQQTGGDNASSAALRLESENEGVEGMLLSPGANSTSIGATHASNVSRRPRQRPRAGPGARGKGKPEENSEEMQRQINEIVQAALKVDSAAKEKERRSRGAERPARRSGTMSGSVDSVVVPLQRSTPFSLSSRRDDVEVDTTSTPVTTSNSQMAFAQVTPSTGSI
ncbi:hypothetical protein V3C99_004299 [Haemonchus contortus]